MTEVIIQEEYIKTGGNFMYEGFSFVCAPGVETEFDSTFPVPTSGLLLKIQSAHPNVGDSISFVLNPDTAIGVAAVEAAAAATAVYFTPPPGIYKGLYVKVGGQDCGRIVTIAADHITFSIALTTPVAVGAVITVTKKLIVNHHFNTVGDQTIGDGKIGGTYIPAGTLGRVIYKNNSATPTILVFGIEYLY